MVVAKHTPEQVTRGDEVNVRVTIAVPDDPGKRMDVYRAQDALAALGISFDTSAGGGTHEWEWDWSLSGPISVTFVRKSSDEDVQRRSVGAQC